MNKIDAPSMNFDSREGCKVDMLVLHYTGMKTGSEALTRLCDEAAKVSAHYMVEESGDVYQLVPEHARAWHAGVSSWRGQTNINQRSVGIEIVNPGHEFGYRAFPDAQMESVIALCKEVLQQHEIPARNVVGHSDVAPTRKEDPGELFDWEKLAAEGIGIWPEKQLGAGNMEESVGKLERYGYDVSEIEKTIIAFQRHFRPELISGLWDEECQALLAGLHKVA